MDIQRFEDHCWQDILTEEMVAIYEPYVRDLYVGKRPALLAIDLYNCVFPSEPIPVVRAIKENTISCGEYAWRAIKPLKELFALARTRKFPIFHATRSANRLNQALRGTKRSKPSNNPRDFDFYPDFRPLPGEIIIEKERASVFFGTSLVAHLVSLGVDSLIVCGESTSGCVRASVVDGHSYGFHMVVVEEAVFDRSLLHHKVSLFDMHHKYADVIHNYELEDYLE